MENEQGRKIPLTDEIKIYEEDYLCRNENNKIKNERHTLTVKNNLDFHYIVPKYAPFFTHDLGTM